MDFLYVFEKMIELFLILIVGYIACRCKIFEKDGRTCVSRLILNVTVPALILSSAMNGDSTIAASQILWILFVATACFIIIFAISFVFEKFLSLQYVTYAFNGIQACVAFLILSAGIKMFKGLSKTPFNIILFSITTALMVVLDLLAISFSSIYYILIGGVIGVVVYLITFSKTKDQKRKENIAEDTDTIETDNSTSDVEKDETENGGENT